MKNSSTSILDANEAVASVAYRLSETVAIYPITPSSPMAEFCDLWASQGKKNLWDVIPEVSQMQSEGGVAGAVHGALQGGSLTTTFTASQGLLLMIPNMYKIAGELNAFCMHVSARSLATHALSIFGDHSDVMACRQTGFAMLASSSVQEAHDLAAVAHAATLDTRVPFMHFFDGFRTSHEVNTFTPLSNEILQSLTNEDKIREHRLRALSPDHPIIRGTAQNPDVFFQAREASNPFYQTTPETVQNIMNRLGEQTGRNYNLFDYFGDPEADRVVVVMGSGAETVEETVKWLNAHGEKTGVLVVRLFRPFSLDHFVSALPKTVKAIGVLDRTKEPGSAGEPLYQDIVTALVEARTAGTVPDSFNPKIIGGRYGLGSKEFTPAMVRAIYTELDKAKPKVHFTVGIIDDVSGTSLEVDPDFDLESEDTFRAVFFGLGSDGTVGANKNTIKIIGEETDNYAQAYFVYDSKKSGAMTVSHLRFGPEPIHAPYLIKNAQFVGCHQWQFLDKYDVAGYAAKGAVFLLNSNFSPDHIWDRLPREVQDVIIDRELKVYTIDAYQVARDTGMGGRINTVMQTCFFAISGILPRDEAIAHIKKSIEKTYSRKGAEIVRKNFAAVDATLEHLHEVPIPVKVTTERVRPPIISEAAPDFVQRITATMMANKGDLLPVSAFPVDGTWPTGTTRWEKRNIAQEIPIWDPDICIQCNKCVMVCPHATIRAKFYPESCLDDAPDTFKSVAFRSRDIPDQKFTIQVATEDCTGCGVCVAVCPAKDKSNPRHKAINMERKPDDLENDIACYDFFLDLPNPDRTQLGEEVKATQFREPLFEYSGACAGCGETPYIKLLTQLYGDRLIISNATGCSSIYGGNLPTTPYTVNGEGRGPAWSNSLFEDNAEFGFGLRLAVDKKASMARGLLEKLAAQVGDDFAQEILGADQSSESGIFVQRERVAALKEKLAAIDQSEARMLDVLADYLVEKSVWIVGGDGWAYDIGYGGLDHVLASGRNVNVLVLDTEVYSNTGGQSSKATPLGAVAKFAASGKAMPKKDLGLLALSYGNVYVAQIAVGARDNQTVKSLIEANAYNGPSLIIAYSHCIAHGYNLNFGPEHQKLAVGTGYWPLYRYDPRRAEEGQNPLVLDSPAPKKRLGEYIENEARYRMLQIQDPERARDLAAQAQEHVNRHYALFEKLAAKNSTNGASPPQAQEQAAKTSTSS